MVARFVRTYPGEFRGGEIAWPWFRYLNGAIHAVEAFQIEAESTAAMIGSGMGGDAAAKLAREVHDRLYER